MDGPRRRCGPHLADGEAQPLTVRGAYLNALLRRLENDPRVRDAALVAEVFGQDPVAVLEERRPFRRLVRLAAHNIAIRERDAADKRAAAAAKARAR